MNTKILIALCFASALFGAAFYLRQESPLSASQDEYLDVTVTVDPNHDENDLTCSKCYAMADTCPCDQWSIYDWSKCYGYSGVKCDDAPASERSACYQAATAVSNLIYPSAKNELDACKNWYKYFEHTWANSQLNSHRWFECCFADSRVLKIAKRSPFYFNKIYKKLYLDCGHINY